MTHIQPDEAMIPRVVHGCLTLGGASGEPDVRSEADDMDVVEGSMAPIEDYSPRHAAKPSCGVAWCRDPNCGRRGARQRPWDRRRLRQLQATTLSA